MNRRTIAGWTGLAVLSVLGAAAVVHPGSGKQRAELTASTASLVQLQPARAMTMVDVTPVIEVRATRL
jgi:hypothetical protein